MSPEKNNLAERIGHFISNWPVWAVGVVIVFCAAVWFFAYVIDGGWPNTARHEWPDDKKKRLAKEAAKREARQAKLKLKKG